jgi:Domain of unknown function (DUF5047)
MALIPSASYNAAVLRPHQIATRIRVFHGTEEVTPVGGIPIVAGSVSATLNSRVTRTLDLQVPFEFFPHDPDDLLSPYRAVLLVESGIRYLDGSVELFPLFKGRVYAASLGGDGEVVIRADDLAADVVVFRFEQPRASLEFGSVVDQLQVLAAEAVPDVVFGTNDVTDSAVPQLTWDEDRAQAMDDLATSLRARWYFLGDGSFVVREYPYETGPIVANLRDQQILSSAVKTVTRDSTANSITVVSERMDGTDPVRVTVRDSSTTSPTQFGGLFGKVTQILRPQTPLTSAQASQLARRQLTASVALTEQWDLTMTALHWLEPGDTAFIRYRGVESTQVVDRITYPLTTDGTMTVGTRSSIPEPEIGA